MDYIYLHGLGQSADSWNSITKEVHPDSEYAVLSLPDLLESTLADYSNLYGGLEAFCEERDEPMVLCGLSLGGVLALHYAIEHPEKLKALVLIATPYQMPTRLLQFQNSLFRLMPASMFTQTGFGKQDFLHLCRSMYDLDFSKSLSSVTIPVLVVCGTKDKANLKAAKQLAALIPHAGFVEIDQAGHEVNADSPVQLARLLKAFYQSLQRK